MFTSRGYRHHSKENRKKSETGQIIQRRPTFQIDNNPVVLDAYKQFFLSTMPSKLLIPTKMVNNFDCTLADFGLIWTNDTPITTITAGLISFAGIIMDQLDLEGKHVISLELHSPELVDSNAWWVSKLSSNSRIAGVYDSIIIDRLGNLSYKQYGVGYYLYSNAWTSGTDLNLTLAYGGQSGDPPPITFGNPSHMKVDVNYYPIWSS